jgi:ABC-type Fe3+-siderophore transport system permease subunit
LTPMDKMWVSFIGIGLMVLAAVIITFARLKTKGWVRLVLSAVALVILLAGLLYGMVAIV